MKTYKKQTIWVSKEAYFYLNRIESEQRGCKPMTARQEEKYWNRIPDIKKRENLIQLDDNSLGGGDGTYNGRWWSWNVDTLKTMLDKAGFEYEDGKEIEYAPVYL